MNTGRSNFNTLKVRLGIELTS
ncbi:hypothetical protein Gotur_016045 [Gossypium turneri]